MSRYQELLAEQGLKEHATARLKAGRNGATGNAIGSISEIVTQQTSDVLKTQQTSDVLKKPHETHNQFGLTETEQSSIEEDINARKPIGDTPAYSKFLKAIFPDKEITFPYLADYDDALIVVSKLSQLFGKSVTLPTKSEAVQSMKSNIHLTGYQLADSGWVRGSGDYGFAWILGEAQGENAPCAWHNRDGRSGSDWEYRRHRRSVIPIFG